MSTPPMFALVLIPYHYNFLPVDKAGGTVLGDVGEEEGPGSEGGGVELAHIRTECACRPIALQVRAGKHLLQGVHGVNGVLETDER
jgi:hypothetical protein